jgi:choline dehydrogenase-like flavoprotein
VAGGVLAPLERAVSARRETVSGNRALERFDVLIIGSGVGGAATAEILARQGQRVLILETGSNHIHGLDDPDPARLRAEFSNDEVKLRRRYFLEMDPLVEPRSYRASESEGVRSFVGDVNNLPRCVGGAGVHSNLTAVRFQPFDFELGSRLRDAWPGTEFADWPLSYAELEPFYAYAERSLGVQGDPRDNPFEPPRSAPYPMPPGIDTLAGERVARAARQLGWHPYFTPHAINSRPYDGRPACAGCGFCGYYGCPILAKGASVAPLRRALLSSRALLLAETRAVRLQTAPGGREIRAVEAIDPSGRRVHYRADRYVLAASPIEDVRLLYLSGAGEPLGNSSGRVGRNLMFHLLSSAAGVCEERLHTARGMTVAAGFADFRGRPADPDHPLGGLVLAGAGGHPIEEALHTRRLARSGAALRRWLRESPMRDRLLAATMYAEDAPQPTNRVDLDPELRDLDELPVPRITYRHHPFELSARDHYLPRLMELVRAAGARHLFVAPVQLPPASRHILGGLRFGRDPARSVCGRDGRFHDLGNLYATGSSLLPTSSGYNPVLTISALGSWVGASLLDGRSPAAPLAAAAAGLPG